MENFRGNNKFFKKLIVKNEESVKMIEIVSDDTVGRSHNRTLIEAGAGMIIEGLELAVDGGNVGDVGCSISFGFTGIGMSNHSKEYHANQVKVYASEYLADLHAAHVILSCQVPDDIIDLAPGHEFLTEIVRAPLSSNSSSVESWKLTPMDRSEYMRIFSPFNKFSKPPVDGLNFFSIIDGDNVICGGALTSDGDLVDPFVTMDCPEGFEINALNFLGSCLRVKSLYYSSNDKFIDSLFSKREIRYVVSYRAVGIDDPETLYLIGKRPWIFGGLLV